MDKKIIQGVAVGAVIVKDSKVLILQRHKMKDISGDVGTPSGKKELFESVESAVVREAKEKQGLLLSLEVKALRFHYRMERKRIRDITQINF